MKEPKMKDLCSICKMSYGKHQLFGDSCPKRGKPGEYLHTKFKLKRRSPTAASREDQKEQS